MTISFLKPARLPGAFIVRARVVKKQGRKLWVRGTLEDGDGEVKAESEALLMDQTPGRRSKL
ncbi:hypothetical protein N657DRAFT_688758 [Parathielavia appendiculata]|uniref:Thioesterase domain-containing protein n=1 Tax=Parathielavia appendiculata TaxID=2587402 RepID=A0AAN6Z6A6_9PEZI|nr:hypothetical protein N657DRAFT_688758 [Parathielavia appendiculata]